jgi:hypothetical protein
MRKIFLKRGNTQAEITGREKTKKNGDVFLLVKGTLQ